MYDVLGPVNFEYRDGREMKNETVSQSFENIITVKVDKEICNIGTGKCKGIENLRKGGSCKLKYEIRNEALMCELKKKDMETIDDGRYIDLRDRNDRERGDADGECNAVDSK